MSDASSAPKLVTELRVSAHLMQLDPGVYCIYHSPGSAPPDPLTGLPGARLSVPPGPVGRGVTIKSFREDGWLGAQDAVALVRVAQGPAQLLMTIYQDRNSAHEAPKLQVTKVVDHAQDVAEAGVAVAAPAGAAASPAPAAPEDGSGPEVAAHLQVQGDVLGRLGNWMGDRGSQNWIEGFALAPRHASIKPSEIEYQAVLGRGWLSPWAEGGQFCGSRGMALPILGLRVRLRGAAAESHTVEVEATFTDGTAIGPVGPGDACEAESLAPLEAFCVSIVPKGEEAAAPADEEIEPEAAAPAIPPARRAARANPAAPAKPAAKPAAPAKPARGRRG